MLQPPDRGDIMYETEGMTEPEDTGMTHINKWLENVCWCGG